MADLYIDFGAGATLTGTCTFTNGVGLTGSGTLFSTELSVGDYVRASDAGGGIQWYKVTVITDDFTVTLDPIFQQATVTDGAGATLANSGAGTSGDAWVHLNQATTDTVRSAGDIIHIQNEQTHTYAGIDIILDEDGTVASFIEIIADDWKALTVTGRGVIDFGGTVNQFNLFQDSYWKFSYLEIRNGTDELLYGSSSSGSMWYDCLFQGGLDGLYLQYYGYVIDSCEFYSNTIYNLFFVAAVAIVKDSIFNGGAGTADYGIRAATSSFIEIINSIFGQTTAHDLYDIYSDDNSKINCWNCKFDVAKTYVTHEGGHIKSYDHQQIMGAYWERQWHGIIEKETTEVRAGGASSSIKADPNSNCTTNNLFKLAEWNEYAVAASSQTRSVYMECTGIVTTFATAAQLWFEAEYYDAAAASTTTTIIKSTAVLSANSTWVEFPVTFTPGQVGRVIYRVYLGYDEGAEIYYVDNQLN